MNSVNLPDSIPWEAFERLFSCALCVDDSLGIIHASPTVKKYLPALEQPVPLLEVFELVRPRTVRSFGDMLTHLDALWLMTARDGSFAIRGQLIRSSIGGRDVLCFCGAPWLFWMESSCPQVKLGMSDFTVQDVQLDQLIFMSTEQQMIRDLERVNDELKTAREELIVAQEAKNRFFAQMSHEMRTPLNGVVSAIALLRDQALPEQSRQLVSMARSSSRNLMHVINYVLDLSKLEAATDGSDMVQFDLSALVDSVIDVVRARAIEKGLHISADVDAALASGYRGNEGLLTQILLNLVTNAIKFTPQGSVSIGLSLASDSGREHRLRFEVVDTGVGIDPQQHERIFQPFWSDPSAAGDADKGTGLGLDIVRRSIETLGGELGLESSPGQGSTFWFELSLETDPLQPGARERPDAGPVQDKCTKFRGRVLIVDDNATNLLLGGMILEGLGIEVIQADGGQQAIAAARDDAIDLVLMDVNMPDIDGVEATRRIRKFADSQSLPIVALSAHTDPAETERCMKVGMNGYLTKPIIESALWEELAKWLPAREQHAADAGGEDGNAGTAENTDSLLDLAVLTALREQIGADNLEAVIAQFREENATRWLHLVAAEESGERADIALHVHSLGSVFRSLGLVVAGDAFAAIEEACRAGAKLPADWLESLAQLRSSSLQTLESAVERL